MLILLIVLPDQLVITSVSKLLFTHIIDISNLELMLCGPDHTKGPSSIMIRPLASRSGGLGSDPTYASVKKGLESLDEKAPSNV